MENFTESKKFNKERSSIIEESFNNVNVDAIDTSKHMLNYDTVLGRWFNGKDVNKNYIILGNDFEFTDIGIGDEIAFDIQGKAFKFIVLGICPRINFSDNKGIYIDINTLKDNTLINYDNSKIEYLIKCDIKRQK